MFTSKFYINSLFSKKKAYNINLRNIVFSEIERLGSGCSLNHIDVSDVQSMTHLFHFSRFKNNACPDISEWDVSNVTHMDFMFARSNFNGDISNWDLKNVVCMDYMFYCSDFNGDLSNWDTSNVVSMKNIFEYSMFNGDTSKWKMKTTTI